MEYHSEIEVLEIKIKHRYFVLVIFTAFVSFVMISVLFLLINNEFILKASPFLTPITVYLVLDGVNRKIMRNINYRNIGSPIISKEGILEIGKSAPINLSEAHRIIFRYNGDERWNSTYQVVSFLKRRQRYNLWNSIDKKLEFDHVEIDHEIYYFKILNQEDKENYFAFVNAVKKVNDATRLMIQGREKELPI